MNTAEILMYARWTGVLLIVLAWIQFVPLVLGWIGLGVAGISFILESIYKKNLSSPKNGENTGE